MKRLFALSLISILVTAATAGCTAATPPAATGPDGEPETTPFATVAAIATAAEPNFLLLISDEPNDIDDFEHLYITFSGVGLVLGDEQGIVEETFAPQEVDLVGLTGEAAVALWAGEVGPGEYTKIFVYVDVVEGILTTGETVEIKLPSNKLHLNLPVLVDEGMLVDFVFDITVMQAGNSGQYILKPQASESGQGMRYRIVEQTQVRERIRVERPEQAGKPEWTGQVNDEDQGAAARGESPDWPGAPEALPPHEDKSEPGRPEDAGRPF